MGISILKSKPDTVMDQLQFRNGTGEFMFWSAQDPNYAVQIRRGDNFETYKMLDSVMNVAKIVSQQSGIYGIDPSQIRVRRVRGFICQRSSLDTRSPRSR